MNIRRILNDTEYIQNSFKRTAKKHPALAEMLNTFEGLALKRAEIRGKLEEEGNTCAFPIDTISFAQGLPVFHDFEISHIEQEFSMVAEALSPALGKAFQPLAAHIEIINKKISKQEISAQECVDAVSDDNLEKMGNLAQALNIAPEIINFILSQFLKIILESKSAGIGETLDKTVWTKGYCPLCGSFPDISFLRAARVDPDQAPYLKAHGGQFWLHCSTCSHEWYIKRGVCPYCEKEDKRHYFTVENDNKARIYTCDNCKKYLVCIDERENIEPDHPEAVLVGAVPLYIIARDKGYTPMVNTHLNDIET